MPLAQQIWDLPQQYPLTDVWVAGRVEGHDGTDIQQADINAITYKVYDVETRTQTGTGNVVVASSVFDTLQTSANDPRWSGDAAGFNFAHVVPGASFPVSGKQYEVQYSFDPSGAVSDFFVVARMKMLNIVQP